MHQSTKSKRLNCVVGFSEWIQVRPYGRYMEDDHTRMIGNCIHLLQIINNTSYKSERVASDILVDSACLGSLN